MIKSDPDEPLAEVEDDKGIEKPKWKDFNTRAVLEARYCKRMVRIIAKYFFFNVYKSLLLELGSRYIDRRQNPDPFDLYDICMEWLLPVRSLLLCYLELFFASTMQSRTKRLLVSRLIFLSLGQWSNYDRKFWSVYLSHVYTPWTIDIQWQHLFVYISRPPANILVYKPRLSMQAISVISTLILFFFLVVAFHLSISLW